MVPFVKYQAAGNDFILLDERETLLLHPNEVQRLCSRRYGIGADGILCVRSSSIADARMLYFNADGSRVDLCLNGLRTVFFHLQTATVIETDCGIYRGEGTAVLLPPHRIVSERVSLDDLNLVGSHYHTGVDHFIVESRDVSLERVSDVGRLIRHHAHFAPSGTNVNFMQMNRDRILVRTYERGVENETLSCGTGAYACFVKSGKKEALIEFFHGEILAFRQVEGAIEMSGPVVRVFSGSYSSEL